MIYIGKNTCTHVHSELKYLRLKIKTGPINPPPLSDTSPHHQKFNRIKQESQKLYTLFFSSHKNKISPCRGRKSPFFKRWIQKKKILSYVLTWTFMKIVLWHPNINIHSSLLDTAITVIFTKQVTSFTCKWNPFRQP